ncbi:PhoP regulatory network protein YrbL [Denitrovibrio acetiphilus DSM 12809]|uniref:PhoP regulatory network protein YrbL n=1 Tax=Denitrovibrio acetiphilus (strain DSM 12809 / NBRC 114555 / N2460) TaxID=522772 RepID=D4H3B7_DENA2|nr:YrbL family protein [Denitrovibrio acetiphilus]ADD67201.1 PhoP regulatory network protein YrbL [Denitrovibrio acetiphilus DSM 12809]
MNILQLGQNYFLASGHQRMCYVHPHDESKVIKVAKFAESTVNIKNQNLIDFFYSKIIEDRINDLSHITRCYGWVSTSMGEGLVVDRVQNYDGTPVCSFYDAVLASVLPTELERKLISDLNKYLSVNQLLFVDAVLLNILLQKINADEYKLVIVDGLGARKLTLKYALENAVYPLRKYKITKQALRLIKDYKKVKARAELNSL